MPKLSPGFLAAAAVAGRYAFFEMFGHIDNPGSFYGIANVDVEVGLVGGGNLSMTWATTCVLLKIVLASMVVLCPLLLSPAGRPQWRAVVAVMAALMLADIGHMVMRVNLAIGLLTSRFDTYLVALFIQTVLYLTMLMGFMPLQRAVAREQSPDAPLAPRLSSPPA